MGKSEANCRSFVARRDITLQLVSTGKVNTIFKNRIWPLRWKLIVKSMIDHALYQNEQVPHRKYKAKAVCQGRLGIAI